jgi:hypothetical protein
MKTDAKNQKMSDYCYEYPLIQIKQRKILEREGFKPSPTQRFVLVCIVF